MSDVFKRLAAVHRERVSKAEKVRLANKKKLARRQAYFKDTGLMDMWEDVKNIEISNPVPETLEGLTITIGNLLVPTAIENIEKTGLVVYSKNDSYCEWCVEDNSILDDESAPDPKHIVYRASGLAKGNMGLPHEHPEAKKKFIDTFIKWLSKYVTPQMLVDMNIDLDAPSVVKRSRKILQLAET